jgi:hypothetical protein
VTECIRGTFELLYMGGKCNVDSNSKKGDRDNNHYDDSQAEKDGWRELRNLRCRNIILCCYGRPSCII